MRGWGFGVFLITRILKATDVGFLIMMSFCLAGFGPL